MTVKRRVSHQTNVLFLFLFPFVAEFRLTCDVAHVLKQRGTVCSEFEISLTKDVSLRPIDKIKVRRVRTRSNKQRDANARSKHQINGGTNGKSGRKWRARGGKNFLNVRSIENRMRNLKYHCVRQIGRLATCKNNRNAEVLQKNCTRVKNGQFQVK